MATPVTCTHARKPASSMSTSTYLDFKLPRPVPHVDDFSGSRLQRTHAPAGSAGHQARSRRTPVGRWSRSTPGWRSAAAGLSHGNHANSAPGSVRSATGARTIASNNSSSRGRLTSPRAARLPHGTPADRHRRRPVGSGGLAMYDTSCGGNVIVQRRSPRSPRGGHARAGGRRRITASGSGPRRP